MWRWSVVRPSLRARGLTKSCRNDGGGRGNGSCIFFGVVEERGSILLRAMERQEGCRRNLLGERFFLKDLRLSTHYHDVKGAL